MNARIRTALASSAVVALAGVGLSISGAGATPATSSLLQTAGPVPVTVDINPTGTIGSLGTVTNPHTATVSFGLDPATCPNALDNGVTFGVAPGTLPPNGTVTAVGAVDGLHCGDTATFLITGGPTATSSSGVTLSFLPVASAPGQSKKLVGTSITVVVTDQAGATTNTGGGSQGNPAAPAVANSYLNSTNFSTCPAYAKKRGALMTKVAAAMPKPESIKDDATFWAGTTYGSWADYVVLGIVTPLCSGGTPVTIP